MCVTKLIKLTAHFMNQKINITNELFSFAISKIVVGITILDVLYSITTCALFYDVMPWLEFSLGQRVTDTLNCLDVKQPASKVELNILYDFDTFFHIVLDFNIGVKSVN